MFSRVRWQLTAWYVALLAAMVLAFVIILYVGLSDAMWGEQDSDLVSILAGVRTELHIESGDLHGKAEDLPPQAVLWLLDSGGQVRAGLGVLRTQLTPDRTGLALAVAAGAGRGHTLVVGKDTYRSFTLPVQTEEDGTAWVQAMEPAERTVNVLHRTLWLIVGVGGAAVLVAGVAGLSLANRALVPIRAAWQRQRDFASDASHELRTPLAVVQAATDLLRARIPQGDPDAETLTDLAGATRRMRGLVDDMLVLARTDSGRLDLTMEPVNLAEVARSVLSELRHLAVEKAVTLEDGGPPEAWLEGNRQGLEQVLTILVDNAIRYHGGPGWVRVQIGPQRSKLVLTVTDNGPGIPAAAVPHIFDRFYRAAPAQSQGTGLGLAIAWAMVKAHGGTVRLQSTVGSGTTFTVELPAPGAAGH